MSRTLLCQKFHIAIVIIKYRVVHTGANIQSGGLNIGLFSNEYHGSLNVMVTKPPINDAENVVARKNINVKNLFLNMLDICITKND